MKRTTQVPVRHLSHRRHGAVLSMELVLVLPIVFLLLFALLEFSLLMAAYARVCSAAQSGARHMSITGAEPVAVQQYINQLLGPALSNSAAITVLPAEYAGQIGSVQLSVPMKNASPDLLWFIGFGLAGRALEARSAMVMERSSPSISNAESTPDFSLNTSL